jgi:hypothetical protein
LVVLLQAKIKKLISRKRQKNGSKKESKERWKKEGSKKGKEASIVFPHFKKKLPAKIGSFFFLSRRSRTTGFMLEYNYVII